MTIKLAEETRELAWNFCSTAQGFRSTTLSSDSSRDVFPAANKQNLREFSRQVTTNERQVFIRWPHCDSVLVHSVVRFVFCCERFSDVRVPVPIIIHVLATNSTLQVTVSRKFR